MQFNSVKKPLLGLAIVGASFAAGAMTNNYKVTQERVTEKTENALKVAREAGIEQNKNDSLMWRDYYEYVIKNNKNEEEYTPMEHLVNKICEKINNCPKREVEPLYNPPSFLKW